MIWIVNLGMLSKQDFEGSGGFSFDGGLNFKEKYSVNGGCLLSRLSRQYVAYVCLETTILVLYM